MKFGPLEEMTVSEHKIILSFSLHKLPRHSRCRPRADFNVHITPLHMVMPSGCACGHIGQNGFVQYSPKAFHT